MRKVVTQTERARDLRRRQTDAERVLWAYLRSKRMHGLKFRRQQPLGPYVVDFVSFERRLVVEVDGGHHSEPEVRAADTERTQWLERNGFRVLRFWNNEVLGNLEGVWEQISRAVESGQSPSPQPPYRSTGQALSRRGRGDKKRVGRLNDAYAGDRFS